MSEQNTQAIINQIITAGMESEKQGKVERYRYLNQYVKPGQIVFAGSSLMEQFPIYEFIMDFNLPYTIYNRGIGGYTTGEMLQVMDVCIYDLKPSVLFLNIGTNDLNGPDYSQPVLMERYEKILKGICQHLPDTRLYLMAYYPVNHQIEANPYMKEIFQYRTNERIRKANEGVRELAASYGAVYLDLNDAITDENGNLKEEITVEGMHMYANGYKQLLDRLMPVLKECTSVVGAD